MREGKKTWAHQIFCNFSKFLEEKNHDSLGPLIKESRTTVDQRGFCDEAGFDKLLRLMDPTLRTEDLDKLKKDLKHPTKDQYDTELLEKCILRTRKLEKKLSVVVDKDSIMQKVHSDLQDMLRMITKYAIKSKAVVF